MQKREESEQWDNSFKSPNFALVFQYTYDHANKCSHTASKLATCSNCDTSAGSAGYNFSPYFEGRRKRKYGVDGF